jgi:hypothetical protein
MVIDEFASFSLVTEPVDSLEVVTELSVILDDPTEPTFIPVGSTTIVLSEATALMVSPTFDNPLPA